MINMSVLWKGKGRRRHTAMKIVGVSVGATDGRGLTITFGGPNDVSVNVVLDEAHAESLRSLIEVADKHGPSPVIAELNRGLAREKASS